MRVNVSAIIVNYNAGELLHRCVNSLLKCPQEIEIIVVDNASTDGSLAPLQGLSGVRIINNPVNVGFAAACNIGSGAASGPFLLFLNPDCFFEPDALSQLLLVMHADERVGLATGLLMNLDGTEQVGGRRAAPTPWRSFVRAFGLVRFCHRWPQLFFDFNLHKQPLPERPIEVEATSGACMLIRREAMDDVGDWDEEYFLHCEDLDLCMRFRQKEWKILFVPQALFIHDHGACSRNRPIFVEYHKHKGMIRFYRKFFRHQYPGLLWPLVVFGVWLRFAMIAGYHGSRIVAASIGGKNV
jgi:GT2 family glycosyltransferase